MSDEKVTRPETKPDEQSAPAEETDKETITEGDLVAKKLISENKSYRDKKRKAEAERDAALKELETFKQKKLEEEGNFKEQAEFFQKKYEETQQKLEKHTGAYAYNVVTSQVRAKAAEMGCIDSEALINLAPIKDLLDDVDEDFNIKAESLKNVLEMEKEKRPYLFKKTGPKIDDANPNSEVVSQADKPKTTLDLARMIVAQKP